MPVIIDPSEPNKPLRLVKLVKLRNSDSALILDHIEVGFELIGYTRDKPVVAEHIFIYNEKGYTTFTSSLILKVVNEDTYQTTNSIYRVIDVVENRDKLISNIID